MMNPCPPHRKTLNLSPWIVPNLFFLEKIFCYFRQKRRKAQSLVPTITSESSGTTSCPNNLFSHQTVPGHLQRVLSSSFFDIQPAFRSLTYRLVGKSLAWLRPCDQVVICRHTNDPATRSIRELIYFPHRQYCTT